VKYDETSQLIKWMKVAAYLTVESGDVYSIGLADTNDPIFISKVPLTLGIINPTTGELDYAGSI